MQLSAWHRYLPNTQASPAPAAVSWWRSPALSSLSSLNQVRAGCGIPITLHSRLTLPSSPSATFSSSRNLGALKCFGMSTLMRQNEQSGPSPLPSSRRHSHEP